MSEKHSAHNNAKLQTSDPLTVFQNRADELSSQQRKILGYRTRKSCFKDDSTTLLLLLENLGGDRPICCRNSPGYYFLPNHLFPIVKSRALYYHKRVAIPECYASIAFGYGTGAPCRSSKGSTDKLSTTYQRFPNSNGGVSK